MRAPSPGPRPPAPGPCAGVTLIEVLIAVTLLSLLTLGMLFAMRIGLTTFAKTDSKLMINRRVAGSQRIVEQELEGLMPVNLGVCGKAVFPKPVLPLFQGQQQSMRLVSGFSLQQAWRGQPQILDLFVIQSDDGPGVRLVVNETQYSPATAGQDFRSAGGALCAAASIHPLVRAGGPAGLLPLLLPGQAQTPGAGHRMDGIRAQFGLASGDSRRNGPGGSRSVANTADFHNCADIRSPRAGD
jgi:prepilin-type N-terminal cleavage/methylation domain-containing protein